MLLTTKLLSERFGDLFVDWTCPLCDEDSDCIPHLFTCSSLQTEWQLLFDKLALSIDKFANKHDLTFNSSSFLHSLLSRSKEDVHFMQDNFNDWIKGFINSSTISQVNRITKSKSLTQALILKMVMKLQSLFRSDIWPKRCIAQKNKEASKGIDLAAIIKSRSHRNATHSRNDQSSSHSSTTRKVDNVEDEVMVLDSVEYFNTTTQNRPTKEVIDRADWGRTLLGSGLDKWIDKGIRTWWMINKDNGIIKKGVKMGQSLLRAVNDQG